MGDPIPPEPQRGELSERDKELIERHKKVKEDYSPGTKLAKTWGEMRPDHQKTASEITDTIVSSNILPSPINSEDVPILVSLSSNVGLTEKTLSEKLGKSYKVIAGDISDVKRVQSEAIPIRFDASFLPFKPESISAMIDFQGAIWHEAFHDFAVGYNTGNTNADNLLDIFARLRKSLREGGVIIIDDPRWFPLSAISTGIGKIDGLLKGKGAEIPGFEVSTIGEDERRLRVFKKVPTNSASTK